MAPPHIRGISSMATQALLADLRAVYGDAEVTIEAVGGVDAAKRVAAGEAFDVVVLAADALAKLAAAGHVLADTLTPLVHSAVAVAVREGAAPPDICSEAALKHAVLSAQTIGYSTGPSGVALAALFERWGIGAAIREHIVQAKPGIPVGAAVASGEVELGFQQLSELMHLKGITVIGTLPAEVAIVTTFCAAQAATCTQPEAVQALLRFLASPDVAELKRRHGMSPA
jgi:molybdate transport system substrate-binding protein